MIYITWYNPIIDYSNIFQQIIKQYKMSDTNIV